MPDGSTREGRQRCRLSSWLDINPAEKTKGRRWFTKTCTFPPSRLLQLPSQTGRLLRLRRVVRTGGGGLRREVISVWGSAFGWVLSSVIVGGRRGGGWGGHGPGSRFECKDPALAPGRRGFVLNQDRNERNPEENTKKTGRNVTRHHHHYHPSFASPRGEMLCVSLLFRDRWTTSRDECAPGHLYDEASRRRGVENTRAKSHLLWGRRDRWPRWIRVERGETLST